MLDDKKIEDLYKQGYRIVGNHSAIKVCMWTKKAIKAENVCYKNTFYGINTHRCVQMTPALPYCTHRCVWCWRDIEHTIPVWDGPIDDPKEIVDGCIKAHVKYLYGFGGNPKSDPKMYEEAGSPKHFAVSLTGEPAMYPRLGELLREIHSRGMTSFLVTNATFPENLKRLVGKDEPTQLYLTLPAPDEETYLKSCRPLMDGGWKRIRKSLDLLKEFKCRRTIRLTLVKGVNMICPQKYADLINSAECDFVEAKGYVWVGYSRLRLKEENMPTHDEIMKFSDDICRHSDFHIIDDKKESRVVLLMKKDFDGRIMQF